MAGKRRRVIRRRQCQNATWEELLQLVEESILPESWPVVENILAQIEEYQKRPPSKLPNGELHEHVHGFVEWLDGLQRGWATLPETIPHVVLLAWRDGYANHPCNVHEPGTASPIPIRRCEDCCMVLPNCGPSGFGACITPCPVCGSDRIGHMKLWAWGTFSPP
jgi:hypothetical protein